MSQQQSRSGDHMHARRGEDHSKQGVFQELGDELRLGAQFETEDLVRFELDVEDLAGREASLLGAYLAEDSELVKAYWRDLKNDVLWQLESRAENWLASSANPAVIDRLRLDYCLQGRDDQLMAGEQAQNQKLSCADCGQNFTFIEPTQVRPCSHCGSEVFLAQSLDSLKRGH